MPGNYAGQLWIFLCVYAGRCDLLRFLSSAAAPGFFKEQRGHRDRKKCIPYHRGKFYSGGIFTDDTGVLSGDRKWKSQSVPVCDASDILSDPDFLGAVSPGTSVYLVCVSDLRGACWSDRDGSVLEDDQWMEE